MMLRFDYGKYIKSNCETKRQDFSFISNIQACEGVYMISGLEWIDEDYLCIKYPEILSKIKPKEY